MQYISVIISIYSIVVTLNSLFIVQNKDGYVMHKMDIHNWTEDSFITHLMYFLIIIIFYFF